MSQTNRADEIRERVRAVPYWRHSIELGHGIVTPGHDRDTPADRLAFIALPDDFTGKSVIDVGAWDGLFAFECERRGASRVVAADHFVWHERGMDGFRTAREILNSRVESMDIAVEDLTVDRVGTFDVCLFLNVLYHLKTPMTCLANIAAITQERLILSTLVTRGNPGIPTMRFFETEHANDPTNWWAPNIECLVQMVRASGFPRVEVVGRPSWEQAPLKTRAKAILGKEIYGRCAIHAWKK
jgi:tRNA (mo5U34)-methyltransferase